MNCPKCRFEQDPRQECLRCGLIFAKYVPDEFSPINKRWQEVSPSSSSRFSLFKRYFRVFRWVSLALSLTVLILILWTSPAPEVDFSPQAHQQAEQKIRGFHRAARSKTVGEMRLNEAELNAWLQSSLEFDRGPSNSPQAGVEARHVLSSAEEPSLEQVRSSVKDFRVNLEDDRVHTYLLFNLYGKETSFELVGRIGMRNGYLMLEAISGKLGSLPIPRSTLDTAVKRLLDSAENRDKFKLPRSIRSLHVVNGQLEVSG